MLCLPLQPGSFWFVENKFQYESACSNEATITLNVTEEYFSLAREVLKPLLPKHSSREMEPQEHGVLKINIDVAFGEENFGMGILY